VTISGRDRKILWARSGNRCAICKRLLVAERTMEDRESVAGEEGHIVARSPGGPRAGSLDRTELDAYDNRILLCREHHKIVDDQRQTYPEERLRRIRAAHEAWVRVTLDRDSQPEPIRVVEDPAFGSVMLQPLLSGADVWDVVADAHGYLIGGPDEEGLPAEACDVADSFLDLAKDWGEISRDVMDRGRRSVREAQRSLGEQLSELWEHGLVAYGATERRIVKGGVLPPAYWWQAHLTVMRLEDALASQESAASSYTTTSSAASGEGPTA